MDFSSEYIDSKIKSSEFYKELRLVSTFTNMDIQILGVVSTEEQACETISELFRKTKYNISMSTIGCLCDTSKSDKTSCNIIQFKNESDINDYTGYLAFDHDLDSEIVKDILKNKLYNTVCITTLLK